jgi:enoyl-CoA hydratase/carnithine racemase|tara:strand:- start:233 stop:961 length:729 start_codon:yes stop_codon:yes gene_type:complete
MVNIMTSMELDVRQGIHVLTLTNTKNGNDNTLTSDVMNEYLSALDQVESFEDSTALMITCEHEKTFSTGINLDWLRAQSEADKQKFSDLFNTVLVRIALLNAPTVACINGNAYAGGAILAAATDYRVMRNDRGRFCFPEVNIKIPFTPISRDIVRLLPNEKVYTDMVLTGIAYTGIECLEHDLVRSIHPMNELQAAGLELAIQLAQKDRHTYCHIRNGFRSDMAAHASRIGVSYVGQVTEKS